jgi:hypothetical protein
MFMDGSDKKFYYLAVAVGSTVGGYIPTLFGADIFSLWSILFAAIFSILAIYITYKLLGN